jgi:hypothetical protein
VRAAGSDGSRIGSRRDFDLARQLGKNGVVADIVATGTWQYDGTVPTEVVYRLDLMS